MTTVKDTIRYLGIYQRTIGANLRTLRPMTVGEAHDLIRYIDEGYAAATLIRLRIAASPPKSKTAAAHPRPEMA